MTWGKRSWPWGQTLAGFGVAAALIGLNVYLSTSIDDAVTELRTSGYLVQAHVIEVSKSRNNPWSRIEYQANGETRTADLKSFWNFDLVPAGLVMVYMDRNDPRRVTTADGHTSFSVPGLTEPGLIGLALGAALVGVVVPGTTAWRRRWSQLDSVEVNPPKLRNLRGVVRRKDYLALSFTGALAAMALAASLSTGTVFPAAIILPAIVTFGLVGAAGKVTVTSRHITVESLSRRTKVPRDLVTEITRGGTNLLLKTSTYETVPIGVGMVAFWAKGTPDARDYRAAQLKTIARLDALLAAIPADPTPGPVTEERRYGPTVLILVSVLIAAVAALAAYRDSHSVTMRSTSAACAVCGATSRPGSSASA